MSKFDAQFAGRLDGQTVLVTGTTKGGIGHETAQGAGNSGATVLVHARHADHARRAVDLLVSKGNGKGQYLAVAGDLGSLAGVRELAKAVHQASPKGLNGLVNNAGAAFATKALSPDGYERTIAINHIAVAALTEELLDLLRKGADDFASPSRVVNMTALIESRGKPITDWSYPGKYSQMHAYADAKLLALMYTYAMARRHQGDGPPMTAATAAQAGMLAAPDDSVFWRRSFGPPLVARTTYLDGRARQPPLSLLQRTTRGGACKGSPVHADRGT